MKTDDVHIEGILTKGSYRHAYAWQIGPFWQDTLDMSYDKKRSRLRLWNMVVQSHLLQATVIPFTLRNFGSLTGLTWNRNELT